MQLTDRDFNMVDFTGKWVAAPHKVGIYRNCQCSKCQERRQVQAESQRSKLGRKGSR